MAKQKETQEKVLTGYEDTGASDTFQQIGDDIALPGTEKKSEEKEVVVEKTAEEIVAEAAAAEAAQIEEEKPNNDDEFGFLKKEEEKIEEQEEETEKQEEEKDIFDVTELETELKKEESQKQEAVKFDWIAFAKKEFDEDITENKPELLVAKVKEKIQTAAQKVIPDTSKYPEDAKLIVEHLEAGGTFDEIINPVATIDTYMATTDSDDLVKDFYVAYEGLSEEDADAKVEELHDDEKFDTKLQEVKKILLSHRQKKMNEILIKSKEKVTAQLQQTENRIKTERAEMAKVVDEMDDFMGMKLPAKAKEYLKTEISNGKLSEKNNNARTQVLARAFELFGKQIIDQLNKKVSDEARTSYNKAKEKSLEQIHNIKPKSKAGGAEEHRASEPENPLAYFVNIDKDAIEVD